MVYFIVLFIYFNVQCGFSFNGVLHTRVPACPLNLPYLHGVMAGLPGFLVDSPAEAKQERNNKQKTVNFKILSMNHNNTSTESKEITVNNEELTFDLADLNISGKKEEINIELQMFGIWKLGADYEKLISCYERLGEEAQKRPYDEKLAACYKMLAMRFKRIMLYFEKHFDCNPIEKAGSKNAVTHNDKRMECYKKLKAYYDKLLAVRTGTA